MKIEFIEAKYIGEYVDLDKIDNSLEKLPKNIFISSSIQFIDFIKKIKDVLEKKNKNVIIFTGKHSSVKGQILGCDIYSTDMLNSYDEIKNIDEIDKLKMNDSCILIISTGDFHALSGTIFNSENDKITNVYSINPIDGKIKKIEDKFSNKGAYIKFFNSNNIGILISTKPGQNDMTHIEYITSKYPEKKFYNIISDNINPNSLNDFNYIDFFINTACPRMIDERENFPKTMINIKNLVDFDKKLNNN